MMSSGDAYWTHSWQFWTWPHSTLHTHTQKICFFNPVLAICAALEHSVKLSDTFQHSNVRRMMMMIMMKRRNILIILIARAVVPRMDVRRQSGNPAVQSRGSCVPEATPVRLPRRQCSHLHQVSPWWNRILKLENAQWNFFVYLWEKIVRWHRSGKGDQKKIVPCFSYFLRMRF